MSIAGSVPRRHHAVAVAAILWNLLGIAAFAAQATVSEARMATLPQAQQDAWRGMPVWAWLAYGTAVSTGLVAAIGLLLRRRWAPPLFAVALAGVVVQFGYSFLIARIGSTVGPQAAIFPAFIALIGVAEIWYARRAAARGWLG